MIEPGTLIETLLKNELFLVFDSNLTYMNTGLPHNLVVNGIWLVSGVNH